MAAGGRAGCADGDGVAGRTVGYVTPGRGGYGAGAVHVGMARGGGTTAVAGARGMLGYAGRVAGTNHVDVVIGVVGGRCRRRGGSDVVAVDAGKGAVGSVAAGSRAGCADGDGV